MVKKLDLLLGATLRDPPFWQHHFDMLPCKPILNHRPKTLDMPQIVVGWKAKAPWLHVGQGVGPACPQIHIAIQSCATHITMVAWCVSRASNWLGW